MSSNLMWLPNKPIDWKDTKSLQLKFILRKKYESPIDIVLTSEDIPYLEGIRDTANDDAVLGAQHLIDAIKKHNEIRVTEVFL